MTTTPPVLIQIEHKLPHKLAVLLAAGGHLALGVGAVVLYLHGNIDSTAFAAIMASLGGLWVGVAGVVKTVKAVNPSTALVGTTEVPAASAAPTEAPPGTIRTDL